MGSQCLADNNFAGDSDTCILNPRWDILHPQPKVVILATDLQLKQTQLFVM